VMLAGGMGYYVLLSALKRAAFTPGLRMLVAGLAIAATAIGFEAILPMVLKLVGRDPTLTGRTELWGLYWRFMQHSIVLGRGPGAFAAGSQLNFSIAPYVQNDFVVSVHNLYLNMFGETGLLGLSLYVLAFLYIAVVAPFRDPSVESTTAAVLGLMILGSGLSEARDTLVPGLASFLVFTLRTLAARQAEDAAVPVARPSRGRPRVGAPALVPQEQAQG